MAASGCSPHCSANFLRKALRRQRLCRINFPYSAHQSLAQPQNRNRQTLRSCQRVRAITQALDRRTYDRLVEPLPPTGQGLGESQSQRSRFPQTRFHPPHVTKAMQSLIKSPDGLLAKTGLSFSCLTRYQRRFADSAPRSPCRVQPIERPMDTGCFVEMLEVLAAGVYSGRPASRRRPRDAGSPLSFPVFPSPCLPKWKSAQI